MKKIEVEAWLYAMFLFNSAAMAVLFASRLARLLGRAL